MFDFEKLLLRLKDEWNMIKQFPIHFISVCFLFATIIVIVLYSSFELALHSQRNTIEGLKGINEVYKDRYGDLSEKDSHPTFDGVFEIPAGQNYVDVVVSLDFKPMGAIGTVMDSAYVIMATVDGTTLTNAATSGIRFNFSGEPSKGSHLAIHIF